MEPPPVQYATTSDGVSIAWAEAGQGPALLFCGLTPFTHVQEQFAVFEAYYGALARSFRLITFDARGTGMSERDVADVSTATLLLDAEAVIGAAKLDRFVVATTAWLLAVSTALQLATVLPERVTHLALESPLQNIGELADTPFGRTSRALAEADWAVYAETVFRVLGGWDAAATPWLDALAKAAAGWVDPAVGLQYMRVWEAADVGHLLAGVRQPTLVLRNEPNAIPAQCCQRIAAKIPGAQFRQYADPTSAQQAELIRAFVDQSPPPPPQEAPTATGTAVILFTDIVASTALTEHMGDIAFRDASRALDEGLRAAIRDAGGTAIDGKLLGDGVLATFPSAAQAIDAARRCHALSAASELRLHLGIHAGDVIREQDPGGRGNVYGGAVNIASRICALSAPGEILVSDVVRGMARSSAGVDFEDRGEQEMKGVGEPVRVYEVRWQK
jgi:class 3 adenylate cyclase